MKRKMSFKIKNIIRIARSEGYRNRKFLNLNHYFATLEIENNGLWIRIIYTLSDPELERGDNPKEITVGYFIESGFIQGLTEEDKEFLKTIGLTEEVLKMKLESFFSRVDGL